MAPTHKLRALGLLFAIPSISRVQGQPTDTTVSTDSPVSIKQIRRPISTDNDHSSSVTSSTMTSYTALEIHPIVSNATTDTPVTSMSSLSSSTNESSIVTSTFAPQPDIPTPTAACEANSSYTIKKGDTYYAVARAYGLTPADILQANPQISGSCDLVYIDQVICLPTGSATTADTTEPSDTSSIPVTHRTASTGDQPTPSTSSTAGGNGGNFSSSTSTAEDDDDDGCTLRHTVVAGDTCYDTWHKYSLTQESFMALNPHLSIRPDGHCAMAVGDVVCVAGSSGASGGSSHPKDPSDQFPKKMSVLSVIPVSDNAKNHPTASAASKRWLPVTFQTSTVRETGDE